MDDTSNSFRIKSIPLADLVVVGVVYAIGPNDEGAADFDYEVLDETLKNRATFPAERGRCDCCGQRLKYACEVVHKPTLQGFHVGRACASKIDSLRIYATRIEQASVAVAEKAACNARERSFRDLHPEVAEALDWCKTPTAPKLASSMLEKLRRYGDISEAQIQLLLKVHAEDLKRRSSAFASAKDLAGGRRVLEGRLLSLKNSPEPGPYGGSTDHWRSVIDLGNGIRLWGTCPQSLIDSKVKVGDAVSLTATVNPSDKDPLFGFFSRPTKATIKEVCV